MLKQIQLTFYILDLTSKFPTLLGLLGTSGILLKNYNISVLIMFIFLHNMCFLPLNSAKAQALCRLIFNRLSILIYIYMSATWKSTWMLFKIWRKISKLIYVFINLQFMLFKNEYFEESKLYFPDDKVTCSSFPVCVYVCFIAPVSYCHSLVHEHLKKKEIKHFHACPLFFYTIHHLF